MRESTAALPDDEHGTPGAGDPRDAGAPSAPDGSAGTMARNAAHLVLGQVATTALAIVLSATLGRSLGAAEFGLFFLFTSMTTFAFVVVDWGQSQYVIREVARRPDRAGELLGGGIVLRVVGSVAAASITLAATAALGYDRRTTLLATLMVVTLLPFFLAQTYGFVFRGRERMEYDALVSVLNKVLTLAFTIAALLLGGGLPGVIVAQGAAGLAALALAVALARRLDVRALRATVAVGRELLVGGTPLVAMALAVSAQAYIDAVVLSKLAPEHVVGWYGASKNILGTLLAPATILGSAAFPRFSRAAQDPERLRTEMHAALRPLVLLAGFAAVGTYLFADLAISIIYGGARFAPSATILKVFAPGFFLLFVDVLLGAVIVASGRSAALAAAKVLNVVVSTALDFLLIPLCQARYGNGGIGAVLAFGGSEAMMFAAATLILPRGVLTPALFLDVGRAVVIAGATLLPFLLLPSLPPILALALATAVFALLAVALRLLGRADLELLASAVTRRAAPRPRPEP